MTAVKPFVIGLTGSIGMGKSETAKLFAGEGVPVFDADAAVHDIYAGEAAAMIEAAFPGTTKNGAVDRTVLAASLKDAGLPPDALAAAEAAETKSALRRATEEAQSRGIYGAPSFTTRSGELFWGNDRLEQAIAWAKEES